MISVCIPATRAEGLAAAIRSVRGQTWSDWEVIVLGQGDTSTRTMLEATTFEAACGDPRVRYLSLPTRGLSRARNAAVREVRGDVIAFLDDDCEAHPDWLSVIAEAFNADASLGLVGGAVEPQGRIGLLSSCPVLTPAEAVYDPAANPRQPPKGWDWIGANFAIRAAVGARVGAWDTTLGAGATYPAAEDTDYKLRMEAQGIRMLSTPRSVVVHASGTRSSRAALRSQRNYQLGNGALAAKQTLSGDPRGAIWRRETRHHALRGWVTNRRPYRLPVDLRRAVWFERGYRDCLRRYRVNADGLLVPTNERDVSWVRSLAAAIRSRGVADRTAGTLTLPIEGGAGGLLQARANSRLVSLLDPEAVEAGGTSVRRWLERRQARHSALLLVPDRATGMRFAGRWRLDLSRIRVGDIQDPPLHMLDRALSTDSRPRRGTRPWHAA